MAEHYDQKLRKMVDHAHTRGEITDFAHTHTKSQVTDYDPPYTAQAIVDMIAPKVLYNPAVPMAITNPGTGEVVSWDGTAGNLFRLQLTSNCKILNPANPVTGAIYLIEINQDDAGLWAVTWDTAFKFPNGERPVISTDPNAIDIMTLYVKSAAEILVTFVLNYA